MANLVQNEVHRLLYSISDTSKALGISEMSVRRMIEQGDLATVRLGRRVMIPTEMVNRFLKKQLRASKKQGRRP